MKHTINMLPTKITNYLKDKYKSRWLLLTKEDIHRILLTMDTEENINKLYNLWGWVTKVTFNKLDKTTKSIFIRLTNKNEIMNMIRSEPSLNYHDYLTTFKFITTHLIYDLIVEVNYRYVYS